MKVHYIYILKILPIPGNGGTLCFDAEESPLGRSQDPNGFKIRVSFDVVKKSAPEGKSSRL